MGFFGGFFGVVWMGMRVMVVGVYGVVLFVGAGGDRGCDVLL